MSDQFVLVDRDGVEWVCVDVSSGRSSYATYACRPRLEPDAAPRMISVPRSLDLRDPRVAVEFLAT